MKRTLETTTLREIEEKLTEYIVGYSGFLSWAMGEIEAVGDADVDESQAWKPAFLVLAGRGRVRTYLDVLHENARPMEASSKKVLARTDEELEIWLDQTWNEVAGQFDTAFPFILEQYRRTYASEKSTGLGWNFDDFMDERDMIEFFLVGAEDLFQVTEFAAQMFEEDCRVRERIAELGLENYESEFFPDRIPWYPPRFWWHHRPEDRVPHPDSLET